MLLLAYLIMLNPFNIAFKSKMKFKKEIFPQNKKIYNSYFNLL